MSLLKRLAQSSPAALDAGLLVVRVGFGLMLALSHGLGKVSALGKFVDGVANRGMPLPWVLGPAAALAEFVGGILIAIGLLTRPAAFFALVTMLVAAFHVHGADPFSKKELALTYAMACGAILFAGPGRYSLDAMIFGKKR
jgi:putative oxidoreductase